MKAKQQFTVTVVVSGPRLRWVRHVTLDAESEDAALHAAISQARVAWPEGERFEAGPVKVVAS